MIPSHPPRRSAIRISAVISLFIAVFLLHGNELPSSIITDNNAARVSPRSPTTSLTSGVGHVTTDGAWGELDDRNRNGYNHDGKHDGRDMKILGFTDRNYLPIARLWYGRLSDLVGVPRKQCLVCYSKAKHPLFSPHWIITFYFLSGIYGAPYRDL